MCSNQFVRPAALLLAAALCAAGAPGCNPGPKTGDVNGKVTFKGKPVSEGTVNFINPTAGGTADAPINPDGTYSAKGVVVGEYVVTINPPIEIRDTDPGKTPPTPVEKNSPNIPLKYRQQGSSKLTASVKAGKNDIDFAMQP